MDLSTDPGSSTESNLSIESDLSTTVLERESYDETYEDPVYGKSIVAMSDNIFKDALLTFQLQH